MKRNICVMTGTRAEYGILTPLLGRISNSTDLELKLIVSGLHLLEEYGSTLNEIQRDDFEIEGIVEMYDGDEGDCSYHGRALGRGIIGFTSVLSVLKPDILLVLGDRLEALAATLAAAILGIPIAHIHGGDKTDSGHIDESIRHSISRFANIHFAATGGHANRLIKMGEEPWRIFNVGALSLDSLVNQKPISKKELYKKFGINVEDKIIVCLFHPVHIEREMAGRHMHEIIEAIIELKTQTIIIYPNNDMGSQEIIKEITKCEDISFIKIFKNLPHIEYLSLLRYADVLIGNSSSGILEAPSFKLPTINIGSRNVGREHADNVIFIEVNKEKIIESINKALYDINYNKMVENCVNPYGDGKTSEKIINILTKKDMDKRLLKKMVTY